MIMWPDLTCFDQSKALSIEEAKVVELRAKIEEIDRRLENENDSTYREQKTEVEDQVQMLLEEARVREEEVNELQVCSLVTSHLFGKHQTFS